MFITTGALQQISKYFILYFFVFSHSHHSKTFPFEIHIFQAWPVSTNDIFLLFGMTQFRALEYERLKKDVFYNTIYYLRTVVMKKLNLES